MNNLIESVNQIRGNLNKNESVLFEWWKVFWNILMETKQQKQVNDEGESKSKRLKSYNGHGHENIKIIIEEGISAGATGLGKSVAGVNTIASKSNANTSCNTSVNTCKNTTEHPYKKLKKKTVPINSNESMNTLDFSSLTGIEKSLLSTNLMNKDLTKLTSEEGKRIESALTNNKVSKESWEIYLRLCKEYQKIPQILKNPKISKMTTVHNTAEFISCNNTNYLGVIDQVNQPIDSRQLLLLRQSLYQEYLKKQSNNNNNSYSMYTNGSSSHSVNSNSVSGSNTAITASNTVKSSTAYISSNSTVANIDIVTLPTTISSTTTTITTVAATNTPSASVSPYFFDENIFSPFEIKDELNFNDFMNEYLI